MKITVLSFYDRISLFQTLKPLIFYKDKKFFEFTNSIQYCLKSDKNRVLFMFRWFIKPDHVDMDQMKMLRQKYDRIFFFNGNAGGGIPRLELLDHVDYFFSKALYRDRTLYKKDFYGDELYNEHYHKKYPTVVYKNNIKRATCSNPDKLKKLKLYWNIGIGDFPKKKLRQRSAVWINRKLAPFSKTPLIRPFHLNRPLPESHTGRIMNKTLPVSARLGRFDDPFLNLHRQEFENKMKGNPLFLTGSIPQNQYNREIRNAAMVLSPFGWGELCFRDFEAINQGALLLKPNVDHLETWPDIFISNETYIPLDWDGLDLIDKAEYYWKNSVERERIALNSYQTYRDQIAEVDSKLEEILDLI